jgi:histidine ammonia-lyase
VDFSADSRHNRPMHTPVLINGNNLTLDAVVAVAQGRPAALDPAALPAIEQSRAAVQQLLAEGAVAYGITTGFGRFKDHVISADQARQLQRNLVLSHAAGVGAWLTPAEVRAMLLVRANTLAKGFSGVRPVVIERLLDLLTHNLLPCVPSRGSLGASGDLAPLAHLALPLIGEGEVWQGEQRVPGGAALRAAGLAPLVLEAKEGLALLNGTTMMVGKGALLVRRAIDLAISADIVAALTLEALNGTDQAYDARVHALRPHPRQIECAAWLRRLLAGSTFLRGHGSNNVQDAYTLRCVPQVHGAVRDAIAYAKWVIDIELNAVNDNPIVLTTDDGRPDIISAGNFHGEPIALAMDYMKLALVELGNMSERRTAQLVDANSNGGVLPMFLTPRGGIESGFMIAHYTAAALTSENKVLAHPASADSIPTSANIEDHVSMGATAVHHTGMVLDHLEMIVGIELLCAAQGIDFRQHDGGRQGAGTGVAYAQMRERVPFVDHDVYMAPLIEAARALVAGGHLKRAVEAVTG